MTAQRRPHTHNGTSAHALAGILAPKRGRAHGRHFLAYRPRLMVMAMAMVMKMMMMMVVAMMIDVHCTRVGLESSQ